MRRRLRVPVAVVFTFAAGCGGGSTGDDDDEPCSIRSEPCVQDPHDQVNKCPDNTCVDSAGQCAPGCVRAELKMYCVPDGTDAGVCPEPAICIVAGEMCPAGCTPVG